MLPLLAVVAFSISLLGVTGVAGAVPGAPPSGKILLGVAGGAATPPQFKQVTGRRHHIHGVFLGWGQGYTWGKRFPEWMAGAKSGNYRLMIHIDTRKGSSQVQTPGSIAGGGGDRYLIAMSKAANSSGQVTYIRPMAEMNGHWNVYSAFNSNGTRRNAAHSTANYKKAFKRITLIMRGGDVANINRRLSTAGMRRLNTGATTLPQSGKVAVVWNPQGEGSPNVRGNQPNDYYPGGAFVDYVANDIYAQNRRAHWVAHNRLYNKYPGKPFMIAEWAPWGIDDPAFVEAMFRWAASHGRTKAIVYFNGSAATTFRLGNKPRSLAKYKSFSGQSRYRCDTCNHSTG